MILDGASSHKAKDLRVPENIRLVAVASIRTRTQSAGARVG